MAVFIGPAVENPDAICVVSNDTSMGEADSDSGVHRCQFVADTFMLAKKVLAAAIAIGPKKTGLP